MKFGSLSLNIDSLTKTKQDPKAMGILCGSFKKLKVIQVYCEKLSPAEDQIIKNYYLRLKHEGSKKADKKKNDDKFSVKISQNQNLNFPVVYGISQNTALLDNNLQELHIIGISIGKK